MTDKKLAPVCGIFCGGCSFLGKECLGCGYVEGKPFWVGDTPTGICPLYDCCLNSKGLEHCGQCRELPCQIFLQLRDPSLSDEEFQSSLTKREDELKKRAEIGTDAWLEEKKGK